MRPLLLIALLPLLACKKEEAETPYAVEDGAYTVTFLTEWDQGDCDFDRDRFTSNFDPAATTISADETSMRLTFDEGGKVLECSREVNEVSCLPVEFYELSLANDGKDAVVAITFGIEGAWESETVFSGVYTHAFSCEGEDCGDMVGTDFGADASFPCTLGGELEATRD